MLFHELQIQDSSIDIIGRLTAGLRPISRSRCQPKSVSGGLELVLSLIYEYIL